MSDDAIKLVAQVVQDCSAHMQGKPPEIQGAVLVELVSMYLAGHFIADSPEETKRLRETMLQLHVSTVRDLIPVNERQVLERLKRRSS